MIKEVDIITRAENIKYNFNCVLEERKAKAEEIRRKKEKLNRVVKESRKKEYINCYNCSSVQETALLNFYAKAYEMQDLLDEALFRFSRRCVSIPFVGYAKQGKTRAILSLAGLDKLIQICFMTGFSLHNDQSMKSGEVKFKLSFFSKEEFTEMINSYLGCISKDYLNENYITFDDIEYISISELESSIGDGEAEKNIKLDHLRKIVDDFNMPEDVGHISLKSIIGKMPITVTDIKQANKYIGFESFDYNPYKETGAHYTAFYGVKKVDIFCTFPKDIGNVILTDLPYNDYHYMLASDLELGSNLSYTIKSEFDGAVVIRKPVGGIHNADIDLFNVLKHTFKGVDTSRWLFYLANIHNDYNDNAVDSFLRDIKEGEYINADAYKADFTDREKLWSEALFPILEALSQNLTKIDSMYMQQIDEAYEKVINNFKSFWEE